MISEKVFPSENVDESIESDSRSTEVDHVAEKKLLRKLDLQIIPLILLLYLFSFLDRFGVPRICVSAAKLISVPQG